MYDVIRNELPEKRPGPLREFVFAIGTAGNTKNTQWTSFSFAVQLGRSSKFNYPENHGFPQSCIIIPRSPLTCMAHLPRNRPSHGFWRHLGWGANTPKYKVNEWDFGRLWAAVAPLKRDGFPKWKCLLKELYTEIIFMKHKEQIQATKTIHEFLRFHTNPCKIITVNCREIKSNMRRFIIWIYGRHTFPNGLIFCWMNDINKTI